MMSGIIYQLISMLSFGTSNVLWKNPQKRLPVFKIIMLRTIVSVILFGIMALLFFERKGSVFDWTIGFVISFTSFFGLIFYNLSLKESKVSHSVTITSISAIFSVLVSVFLYNEQLHLKLVISLLFVTSGLFFLESKKPLIQWSKGTIYAVLAAFFWGTTFALFKIPVEKIGNYNFSFVLEISVLLGATILFLSTKKNKTTHLPTISTYLTVGVIGVLGFLGVLFYNMAIVKVPVSILSVMGAFTPVISIVISHIFLKEKFTKAQYIGMTATLIGVILLVF